ncbi:MAG: nucleotidyltransferase family protein [Candidatus Omnitrophica bacterium]|nr:nucleotidyltransferase family protein [Candidatus Omnitrophota bacterium]
MNVVILAAGYAVRLEPLTLTTPKPLLEVGGRRIVDRLMDKISGLRDVNSVTVITNAKFLDKFVLWKDGSAYKGKLLLLNDASTNNDNRLGAIKDLMLATNSVGELEDLLVIAGDNLFDFGLDRFVKFAKAHDRGVSVALYDIGSIDLAKSFGVLKIDSGNKVVSFEEKPQTPKSTLISTGIYYFPKDKIGMIKEYSRTQERLDAPGYYISWLANKGEVYGCPFTEDWYDIGNIESYKKADAEYKNKEKER